MNQTVVSFLSEYEFFDHVSKLFGSHTLLMSFLIFLLLSIVVVIVAATIGGLGTFAERKVSADMQMAYSEDELDEHIEVLNNADVVPKVLNDDTMDPNKIVYNGDLKKKDLEGFAKHFDEVK